MLTMHFFNNLSRALPKCDLILSNGDLQIVDRYAEVIGEVNFEKATVKIFDSYEHSEKVIRRLKRASIPVELQKQSVMEQSMKILYDC